MESGILQHIELLTGSIGVTIALFFGLYLLFTHKQRPLAHVFLAIFLLGFGLRIGKSLFFNYFYLDPVLRNVFLGCLLLTGPSLWLHSKALRQEAKGPLWQQILPHYLPFALFTLLAWLIPNDGSLLARVVFLLLHAHIAVYTLLSLVPPGKAGTSAKAWSPQEQRWLLSFTLATLGMVCMTILVFFALIPYLSSAYLFTLIVLFLLVQGLRMPDLFVSPKAKYQQSSLSQDQMAPQLTRLQQLMAQERLYQDPSLSLQGLSAKMGLSSKQLSQLINQTQGENFSRYIARHRIAAATQLLSDPAYAHYKIAAIAFESGFNSISTFNSTFKRLTGQTAAAYRKQQAAPGAAKDVLSSMPKS